MIPITAIGSYFELDAAGHIQNPTASFKIDAALRPLVDALIATCLRQEGERLVAVYLRGSVPRGLYVPGVSDVDVVCILNPRPDEPFVRWGKPAWAQDAQDDLKHWGPIANLVDFAIAHRDLEIPGCNPSVKFVLKTQGLCVFGEDDTRHWPAYKADRYVAFHFKWLASELEIWKTTYENQPASPEKVQFLQGFAKTVLRVGFELVMEREGRYTVDLYPCLVSFARHYPHSRPAMEAALHCFLNPTESQGSARQWIDAVVPLLMVETRLHLVV